jgi:transcriptional regulator with XRE-family HTH domain
MKRKYTLKELRTKNKESQKSLGKKLKVTQRYIGMLENGDRVPSYSFLCKLAEHFGISIDQIDFKVKATDEQAVAEEIA